MRGRARSVDRLRHVVLAIVVAGCGLAASAASAGAANFTWSGAAAVGEPKWSNGTNWGGTAPSGSVGALTFPVLTSPGCTAEPRTATCYRSENDVSGLEISAISIHSPPGPVSSPFGGYDIRGQAVTLGAGGLSVSGEQDTFLDLPITLAAPQTWSFEGPSTFFGWHALSPVTGTSDSLGLDLSKGMLFVAENDVEVGALTITGANPSDTGSAARENGELRLSLGASSLNGTDGNPVHLVDAALFSNHGTFGPLTSTGGEVDVYLGETPGAKFTVAGAVTLDAASEMRFWITNPGTIPAESQLSASGPVNLANAHLSIWGESELPCPLLHPGDVHTLITTTGSLTGTFSGIPDGSTIALECSVETPCGTQPTVKINYTPHTVTATVEEATVPGAAKCTTLTTSLSGEGKKGESIAVKEGKAVTDNATLSGESASKATGTVTYKIYSDNKCTALVKEAGTVTVSGGVVPASEPETLALGTYYWQASYGGDTANEKSSSTCGAETETVTAKAATCGKTTVGKFSDTLLSNLKRVNKCMLPVSAVVSELTVYLSPTSTKGQQLIKGIIYADSKGKPAGRLSVTGQLTFKSTNSAGWYHLAFPAPVKVGAGTYWIGIITGSSSNVAGERYDAVKNAEDYNSNSYTSGPTKLFGSFKTTNEEMSLYATYTPGSA